MNASQIVTQQGGLPFQGGIWVDAIDNGNDAMGIRKHVLVMGHLSDT